MSNTQKTVIINGLNISWKKSATGVENFCNEVTTRLDKMEGDELKFIYITDDSGANKIIDTSELSMEVIHVSMPQNCMNSAFKRLSWRSKLLKKYQKQYNATVLCMGLEPLICKNQIQVVHDIRPKVTKFDTFKFKLKNSMYLHFVKKYSKKVITVSEYQKKLITKHLHYKSENVFVVYPGYDSVKGTQEDENIFVKFPEIKKGEYYYTLGSLAPHKNFKWMIEVAKRNPQKTFVVAGGKNVSVWKDNIEIKDVSNLFFTGYVSDEENVALYKNCKAFLFPSKFEGFGVPPIEALYFGANVAVSNATCLPEVYEDTVRYFDPDDYDVNLDELMNLPVASADKIFKKCNYDKCAREIYDILLKN